MLDECLGPLDHPGDVRHALGVDRAALSGIDRGGHAADEEVRMGVLSTEDRVQANYVPLPVERLQVVGHGQEVDFGREFVRRVTPVPVREDSQLPALHESLKRVLDLSKVGGGVVGPLGQGAGDTGGLRRIGRQGAYHVHPVQGVQVIEVHDVVLHELHALQKIADHVGCGGDPEVERVLHGPHRGERVDHRAHAADALREGPGISRVTALQDDLEAAELRAGRPGIHDALVVFLHLDPQVPLDARDRVDDDEAAHDSPPGSRTGLGMRRSRRSMRTFSVSGGRR